MLEKERNRLRSLQRGACRAAVAAVEAGDEAGAEAWRASQSFWRTAANPASRLVAEQLVEDRDAELRRIALGAINADNPRDIVLAQRALQPVLGLPRGRSSRKPLPRLEDVNGRVATDPTEIAKMWAETSRPRSSAT